jgi:hypothetical protein
MLIFSFILARRREFHMSEISASVPVHPRILIGDALFMPIFLKLKAILANHHVPWLSKRAANIKRLWLAQPSRVSQDMSINRLLYLRRLDLDLPCAFSATCTPREGFWEEVMTTEWHGKRIWVQLVTLTQQSNKGYLHRHISMSVHLH